MKSFSAEEADFIDNLLKENEAKLWCKRCAILDTEQEEE